MDSGKQTWEQLQQENCELRAQLADAQEQLRAVREGPMGLPVVSPPQGWRQDAWPGSIQAYRTLLDQMPEGVIALAEDGRICYSNRRFAALVQRSLDGVIGSHLEEYVISADRQGLDGLLARARGGIARGELTVRADDGTQLPVRLGVVSVMLDGHPSLCVTVTDITERRRVEQALRRSEQIYQAIGESIDYGVWVCAADGRNVYASDSFLRLVGQTQEQCSNFGWGDVLHPEDSERTVAAWKECVRTGGSWDITHRFRGVDGRWHHVLARGIPVRDEAGTVLCWAGINLDIDELKRTEAALHAANTLVRLAHRAANAGAWEWNVRTNANVWSDELWQVFGLEPHSCEPSYETWLQTIHPVDRARTEHVVQEALRQGAELTVEWRRCDPGGREHWLMSRGQPLRDFAGHVDRYIGVVIDITAHKRQEEHLRLLSEVTSQLLAGDQPERIVESLCRPVMDHLGCQIFFNFVLDERSGLPRLNASAGISEETAGRIDWLDCGSAADSCAAREACRLVAERMQSTLPANVDLIRSLGIRAYACHPLLEQDRVIGTLSFGSRTKTAFTSDEMKLMKSMADQIALALQRARLLEMVRRGAAESQAANVAKGRFLAHVSHELRTPMNAILGMINVALPKSTDPRVKDCLETAKNSADLLLALLNDLLDSSKIDSGKLELESAPFRLRQLLDHVAQTLALRASEKGLCFACRMSGQLPDSLVGDRLRLQQVLLNLAGNAIKFTQRGEVEIRVCASPGPLEAEGDVLLEFAVRDTGMGIPEADLERIFEPFSQADASTSRRFGGTGLGLGICRGLVEMMGGRLWVESAVGQGSTFYFSLRLTVAAEMPPKPDTVDNLSQTPNARLRILLVDDNHANRLVATCILEERGHQVETASDGMQALRLTQDHRYDVILMDVQMPGMDGLEATAVIRAREAGRQRVPIIALTAHAMQEDREQCLAGGMDGYLSKPIDAPTLIALVEGLAGAVVQPLPVSLAAGGLQPEL